MAAVHDYAGWLTDRHAELAPRADEANAPLNSRNAEPPFGAVGPPIRLPVMPYRTGRSAHRPPT